MPDRAGAVVEILARIGVDVPDAEPGQLKWHHLHDACHGGVFRLDQVLARHVTGADGQYVQVDRLAVLRGQGLHQVEEAEERALLGIPGGAQGPGIRLGVQRPRVHDPRRKAGSRQVRDQRLVVGPLARSNLIAALRVASERLARPHQHYLIAAASLPERRR